MKMTNKIYVVGLMISAPFVIDVTAVVAAANADIGVYGWYYNHSDESLSTVTTTSKWNLVVKPEYFLTENLALGLKLLVDRQTDSAPGGRSSPP